MATVTHRPLAVVTGASSGIGLELARVCVENDFDAVVCAEDTGIHHAAAHLSAAGAFVHAVRADLATFEGCEQLYRAVVDADRPVDALVLNAGFGVIGRFVQTDLEDELRMIAVNCGSVVHLAKRIVPMMIRRHQGRVLVTASVATSPAPLLAAYGASKAFDLSFAESLRAELVDTGVTVTALQAGATDTELFERAEMTDIRVADDRMDDPAVVAKIGFDAMMEGKDKVIAASFESKLAG